MHLMFLSLGLSVLHAIIHFALDLILRAILPG